MGLFFFLVLIFLVVAYIILGGGYILFLVSKLFKVQNATFKTTLRAWLGAGIVSSLVSFLLLFVLPALPGVSLIPYVVNFLIFYYFFTKYYSISWLKSFVVYIVFLIVWALISVAIAVPTRLFVVQPFMVSGEAMSPTYPSGEYLLINHLAKSFNRGDVIVFQYPRDPSQYFIKRIIGLPGDTLSIENGAVIINGEPLVETYISEETPGDIKITLGLDEYFVMGDNRDASSDSRVWGPIKRTAIIGKVLYDVANFSSLETQESN